MSLQTEKIELAQKILASNNKSFIAQIKEVVNAIDKNDFWEELTAEQQSIIRKAQKQAANGDTHSHSSVMAKHKKWLSK